MHFKPHDWRNAAVAGFLAGLGIAAHSAEAPRPTRTPAGPMAVDVDASNVGQWIYQVRQTIPAAPGPLRLHYPRWLPGFHGPHGDTTQIAGLMVQAGGQPLPWQRPAGELQAFDVVVPAGARAIEVSFQWLGAPKVVMYAPPMTRDALGLQWHAVVLYPAGYAASAIEVRPRLKLPAGWRWGSALRARGERDGWTEFEPVSLETLVDSPVYAGPRYQRIDLDPPGAARPVTLHVIDDAASRAATPEQIDAHRRLVVQLDRLFGSRPWQHYDLLLVNAKGVPDTALEHHESSENGYPGNYFDDWATASRRRDDLPHEFVHAWNGKFRRPADLWAADFHTPSSNSLLWVYEGLTQYWGMVIAARSGLITPEQVRHMLAGWAAWQQALPGRRWRPLQDTPNAPALASHYPTVWPAWMRGWDYYPESALQIWLDADTLIRERTGGARSLDDFARAFFGGPDGHRGPDLYGFDDVVAALNQVLPHDWHHFLRERLDRTVREVKLEGLERSGWRLGFSDTRSALMLASQSPDAPTLWLGYSLGLGIGKDGEINEVQWDSPAFGAGLSTADKVIGVNMQAYTPDRIEAALVANKDGRKPVELLLRRDDELRIVRFDVRTGPMHRTLLRIDGTSDRLAEILSPR